MSYVASLTGQGLECSGDSTHTEHATYLDDQRRAFYGCQRWGRQRWKACLSASVCQLAVNVASYGIYGRVVKHKSPRQSEVQHGVKAVCQLHS